MISKNDVTEVLCGNVASFKLKILNFISDYLFPIISYLFIISDCIVLFSECTGAKFV